MALDATGLAQLLISFGWLGLFGVVIWIVWQIGQVVHDYKEWVRDRVSFERGLITKISEKAKIDLTKFRAKHPEIPKSTFNKLKDEITKDLLKEVVKPEKK